MDLRRESLRDLARRVRSRDIGARELTQHALDRIDALNASLNAFVAVDADSALRAAAAIDERAARGEDPGRLAGIPIGVKDLEDAAGFVTSHGSHAFAGGPPADADSPLVARLKAAGCVVVGKTNTPELGWKGETDNPVFGATRNPWEQACTPGGSSGGSAAAIASGMVPLATGSDGGGSIRIPSAFCGLSGLKPSLGRVPAGGSEPPGWPDLSTKGPMAIRVRDVAVALDAVVGPDPSDLRALPLPEASWVHALDDPAVPIQVAWSPTLGYADPEPEVLRVCSAAVEQMAGLGADVVEIDKVFPEDPVFAWITLAATYNSRTLEPFRGTAVWERIDPGLVASIEQFGKGSALDLAKAQDAGHRLNLRLVEIFRRARLLLTPTVASAPFPRGQAPVLNWVSYTYPFNMTRSPAGTLCAGFTGDGLPVGLQLVGPQHGDIVVLRAMAALEDALAIDRLAPI